MAVPQKLKKYHARGISTLAWVNVGLAYLGGFLIASTFVGEITTWAFTQIGRPDIPKIGHVDWLDEVLTIVLVFGPIVDMLVDFLPERMAIYGALLGPVVARSAGGSIADTVYGWSEQLTAAIGGSDKLAGLIGTTSTVGLAVACTYAALEMSKRVVKKQVGGGRGGRGAMGGDF